MCKHADATPCLIGADRNLNLARLDDFLLLKGDGQHAVLIIGTSVVAVNSLRRQHYMIEP
jgi:hypothetical protein